MTWTWGSKEADELTVPDFAEPFIGYRMWKLGIGDTLLSPSMDTPWIPGEPFKAECLDHILNQRMLSIWGWAGMMHGYSELDSEVCVKCPSDSDRMHGGYGCGIYAWSDFDSFLEHGYKAAQVAGQPKREIAIGTVFMWGRVQEQEMGYRSEFAAVRSLYATHTRVGRIASRFGVELESIPRGLTYKERRKNG